jgi:uncharacterized membrane protein
MGDEPQDPRLTAADRPALGGAPGGRSAPAPAGGQAPAPATAHVMDPLERTVQRVLRDGLAVSFALMAVGIVLAVARGQGLAPRVVPLAELGAGLVALDSAAYLSLGLIALIATPFVRVAGSLLAFVLLRDRRYALVTAIVLAVMCASVALGRA